MNHDNNRLPDKESLRRWGYRQRQQQADKALLSHVICRQFVKQSEYLSAETVMWYVHCRTEVQTLDALREQLKTSKRIVVPYCTEDETGHKVLGLWLLNQLEELVPGMWGILEPPRNKWWDAKKRVRVEELDMIMTPGVVFDRNGGRLGNGAGYYDRLLQTVRSDTRIVGVCFESQLVEKIPMAAHDVYMHNVITEKAVYPG